MIKFVKSSTKPSFLSGNKTPERYEIKFSDGTHVVLSKDEFIEKLMEKIKESENKETSDGEQKSKSSTAETSTQKTSR